MYIDKHRDRGIHRGDCLDGQHRIKEAAARAAQRFGNLDPHQSQFKQLVHEPRRKLLLVIHRAHRGRNRLLRKLPHRCVEHPLFFSQLRQWGREVALV